MRRNDIVKKNIKSKYRKRLSKTRHRHHKIRDEGEQELTELIGEEEYESKEDIPFSIALPAFITSELKTAFQIGFLLFLPFLVIDMVVASVLMSLGMMMLSPMLIALPFKLLLFVLVDGWAMTVGSLVGTF